MTVAGRNVHILKKVWLWWKSWHSAKKGGQPQTHYSSCQISREIGSSLSVLYSTYRTPRSCLKCVNRCHEQGTSEVLLSCIHHARFVNRGLIPVDDKIWGIIRQRVYLTKVQDVNDFW